MPRFFTTEEVAAKLRVSIFSVQRWIRESKLNAKKVGIKYLIAEDDLKKFIEEGGK